MALNILPYKGIWPKIDGGVFLAPNAYVIGDVEIGPETNIWFGCVVRGDMNVIRIGRRVNVQDATVIHVDSRKYGTFIGDDVTIGHSAIIHACTLEDRSFIGMQACIMDGAVVESGAMVAAGGLITPGKVVKAGQLWAGKPARFVRDCGDQERDMIAHVPPEYWKMAQRYLEAGIGRVDGYRPPANRVAIGAAAPGKKAAAAPGKKAAAAPGAKGAAAPTAKGAKTGAKR
jgi:carbonic anhydrase/acetyltransferase-like protein (isoleucine patch superfamily)